jgi:hypothetical protein
LCALSCNTSLKSSSARSRIILQWRICAWPNYAYLHLYSMPCRRATL